jgi:hypothetical protein
MKKRLIPFSEVSKNFQDSLTPEEKKISTKRRQLRAEKLKAYMETVNIPYDDDIEKYAEWLNNTPEGKEHARNLERIREEVNIECEWGGKREGAGRKNKEVTRVTFTRRLLPETIAVLKDYAKEHDINETEALEVAISKLKQA